MTRALAVADNPCSGLDSNTCPYKGKGRAARI